MVDEVVVDVRTLSILALRRPLAMKRASSASIMAVVTPKLHACVGGSGYWCEVVVWVLVKIVGPVCSRDNYVYSERWCGVVRYLSAMLERSTLL